MIVNGIAEREEMHNRLISMDHGGAFESRIIVNPRRIFTTKALLSGFVIFWGVITPVLGLAFEQKYLSIGYALIFVLYILINKKLQMYRWAPIFGVYLSAIFMMFLLHLDISSILNLGSLFVSVYVISLLAMRVVADMPSGYFELFLGRVMFAGVILAMLISTLLTAFAVHGAPTYYFWNSFVSDRRLLLISGNAGQTVNTWFIAFSFVYLAYSERISLKYNFKLLFVFAFYATLQIYSRNRIALLFVGLMWIAYLYRVIKLCHKSKARLILWPTLMLSLGTVAIYSLLPFSNSIHGLLVSAMTSAQEVFPNIRIYTQGAGITSGRDILNLALFKTSLQNPLIGLGNSADILKYGITKLGAIAYLGNPLATTESSFRLAVKYGWIFYFTVLGLIISPLFGKGWRDSACVFTVLIVLFTFIFEGALENLYSQGSIFMLLVLIYYFRRKLSGSL